MPHQDQSPSKHATAPAQQPPAMQVLNAEEMRAVVGGRVIKNGGGGAGITTDAASSKG